EWQTQISFCDQVNRTAIVFARIGAGFPLGGFVEQFREIFFNGHHHARTARPRIETSRSREHGITNFLGGKTAPIEAPEKTVLRIFAGELWLVVRTAGLLIGIA